MAARHPLRLFARAAGAGAGLPLLPLIEQRLQPLVGQDGVRERFCSRESGIDGCGEERFGLVDRSGARDRPEGEEEIALSSLGWNRALKKVAKVVAESAVGNVRMSLLLCCSIIGHLLPPNLVYLQSALSDRESNQAETECGHR